MARETFKINVSLANPNLVVAKNYLLSSNDYLWVKRMQLNQMEV